MSKRKHKNIEKSCVEYAAYIPEDRIDQFEQ